MAEQVELFVVQARADANQVWQACLGQFSTMDQAEQWAKSDLSGYYYRDTRLREWRIVRILGEVVPRG